MSDQITPVAFRTETLYVVKHDDNPYIPMKPIVEGMGLSWSTQQQKIKKAERYVHMNIPLPSPGGLQDTLCIPLRKLNGWLFTINPQKVKSELRERVIAYQEECFQALYDYWNNKNSTEEADNVNEMGETVPPVPDMNRELPLMGRVDAALLREYRILDKRLAMAYLENMGITSAYVGSVLLCNDSDCPVGDSAPVAFINSRVELYAKHEDDLAWYLTRDEWNKCCNDYDAKATATWLRDIGCLRTERNRLTTKGSPLMFSGSRPNVFAVLKGALKNSGQQTDQGGN